MWSIGAAGMQEHRDGGAPGCRRTRHGPIPNPSITKAADGITGAGPRDGPCGVCCGVEDLVMTVRRPTARVRCELPKGAAQMVANTKHTDVTAVWLVFHRSCRSTREVGSSLPLPTHAQSTCRVWAGFAQEDAEDEGCPGLGITVAVSSSEAG